MIGGALLCISYRCFCWEFLLCLWEMRKEGEKQESCELRDFPWLLWWGHLKFEICSKKCKLLTGLATTPILRIDGEVTGWARDLFTLPNDRVDSLQWRKYDPALSQKWPLSLRLYLYHCWQNAADGWVGFSWGTTKSSKVVRDIGFQWSQKKHLAGQTWVLRWRIACCCVWDKSGKVKWRSLALT